MGKTDGGAVWLDKNLLSPYNYWQFWRNVDDRDVVRFLQMFTDLKLDAIKNFQDKNENINKLKILLANETTKMLHGESASKNAELTAKKTFENKSIGQDLPTLNVGKETIKKGISIVDLVILSKLSFSKSEVRRIIKNKGIRINNKIVESDEVKVELDNFDKNNIIKLSHGKKQHVIVKII